MTPVVLDVRNAQDVRDVVHRAVQALAEGKLVGFPTESVYGVAASAMNEHAVDRLCHAAGGTTDPHFALAIKSADEALDYVPQMGPLCQRLARRCWPGPVTLKIADNDPESLLRQLPRSVRDWMVPDGYMRLRVPAHRLVLDVMRLLPGPLALVSPTPLAAPHPVSAEDLMGGMRQDVDLVLDEGRSQFNQAPSVVQIEPQGMSIVHRGVVSHETLRRLASMLILFVCTGNTCRSPMAEALCRQALARRLGCREDQLEDRGILVMSAGVAAGPGSGPTPEAVEVMTEMGTDLSQHVAQPISERLVRHADVIFTMTQGHRQALVNQWPELAGRTTLLSPDQIDVADPIGGPRELYRRCAEQLQVSILQRLDQLELPEPPA